MRKNNYFGLIAMSMGLGFIMLVACSKDDGCETKTYYLDKDMDNYGVAAPTMACSPPSRYGWTVCDPNWGYGR